METSNASNVTCYNQPCLKVVSDSLHAGTGSFPEELLMELDMVQQAVNSVSSDLMPEGRLLMK